jgi:hypothetical protein
MSPAAVGKQDREADMRASRGVVNRLAFLCRYYESGYGETPSRIRLVTIGVWVDQPDREAVNTRQLADDPLTRSYILSLGQSFNTICPSVPDPLALLQYGYYNEYNGQKDMFKSAFAGDAPKMFHDVVNLFKRVRPHMVDIAYDDAKTFVIFQQEDIPDDLQIDPSDCMSPQMTHLYANIARLPEERRTLPSDVEDDAGLYSQLRADAQKQVGFDPRAPRVVTPAQAMKKGCGEHTAGAAASGEATAMEIYCRCLVDAAIMAGLPAGAMRTLGAAFDDRSLKDAGDQYPSFAAEKKACYH